VNALVSVILHPPAGGWGAVRPQFYMGIALAAVGGCMVTYFKPPPAPAKLGTTAHVVARQPGKPS
jgi:hypothetical protein